MKAEDVMVAVLASGSGTRFGSGDKLIQPFANGTIISAVINVSKSLKLKTIISICDAENLARIKALKKLGVKIVPNDAPDKGMGHSLALAAQHAKSVRAEGLMVVLADMPLVTHLHLEALLDAIGDSDVAISLRGARRHPPILFSNRCFDALSRLSGETAGRDYIAGLKNVVDVPISDDEALDIDTPNDLERAKRLYAARRGH